MQHLEHICWAELQLFIKLSEEGKFWNQTLQGSVYSFMHSWALYTAITVLWSPKFNSNPEWGCPEIIIINPLFFTPDELLFKGHSGVIHTILRGKDERCGSSYNKKDVFSGYMWRQCTRHLKLWHWFLWFYSQVISFLPHLGLFGEHDVFWSIWI